MATCAPNVWRRPMSPPDTSHDLDGLLVLVNQPALAHAVGGEPAEARLEFPHSGVRRQHLQDHIGRPPDSVLHNPEPRCRDEQQVRLHDEVALAVQDDVHG
jgi:hypothetical protein